MRLADHIEGMDYIRPCVMCAGDGEYDQTYTAGCGMGYYRMRGPCSHCGAKGITTTEGRPVSSSVVNQIEVRARK